MSFVDLPLVGLQPWQMGITKAGDPVRRHRHDQGAGLPDQLDGLQRQPVHQVEVQIFDAGRAQAVHRGIDHGKRLKPAYRDLNQRVDVLNAEACTVDADIHQPIGEFRRDVARIKLDGVLEALVKRKPTA